MEAEYSRMAGKRMRKQGQQKGKWWVVPNWFRYIPSTAWVEPRGARILVSRQEEHKEISFGVFFYLPTTKHTHTHTHTQTHVMYKTQGWLGCFVPLAPG
jgi:hypothetical protein